MALLAQLSKNYQPKMTHLDLQKHLKLNFKNPQILHQALIHRSYLNENQQDNISSNERYEFLGDAVLETWISDYLFRQYPQYQEGDLTNLRALSVCTQNLSQIAKNINLSEYLLLSKGEEKNGGRQNPSILADTLESVIGAIYLDQGMSAVSKFLHQHLTPSIQKISQLQNLKDPKSTFQEIAQAKTGTTPHYQVVSQKGPDHKKIFEVAAYIGQKLIATGTGNSKQKAEEDAASKASQLLK